MDRHLHSMRLSRLRVSVIQAGRRHGLLLGPTVTGLHAVIASHADSLLELTLGDFCADDAHFRAIAVATKLRKLTLVESMSVEGWPAMAPKLTKDGLAAIGASMEALEEFSYCCCVHPCWTLVRTSRWRPWVWQPSPAWRTITVCEKCLLRYGRSDITIKTEAISSTSLERICWSVWRRLRRMRVHRPSSRRSVCRSVCRSLTQACCNARSSWYLFQTRLLRERCQTQTIHFEDFISETITVVLD